MADNALSSMRILMFPRTMAVGGTEKVVLQLCEHLVGKVGYLGVISCGGAYTEELRRLGVPHYQIPDITSKNPSVASGVVQTLRLVSSDNGVNVIHCHHRMAAFYSHFVSDKTLCAVATAHNVFHGRRYATRAAYRGMRVVACGKRVEENLVGYYGLPREAVTLITNSVKPFGGPVRPIAEVADCPAGVLKVGFVGRLTEAKGVTYLIDAIGTLRRRGVPVRCFLVGEGELEAELRRQVEEAGLTGDVVFLGRRDDSQNFLSQMDVCVLPSLWEGLPMVLLEAFSVGTAVVASSADGILDVVTDGENGLITGTRDADGIADAVQRLHDAPDFRSALGQRALASYQADYSYERWADRYDRFYEEAVSQ
jgi:glycosyltransferase involved in cell wall biosynthesis